MEARTRRAVRYCMIALVGLFDGVGWKVCERELIVDVEDLC